MNIILFSRKQVKHRPEQLRRLLLCIEQYGYTYTINEEFASAIEQLTGITVDSDKIYMHKPSAMGGDVMITYGGDGTLLEAVGILPDYRIPVVGINSGRLGYLTVDDGEGIEALFDHLSKGTLHFEERRMLQVIEGADDNFNGMALNEIAIHRHGTMMVSVETRIDGKAVATYHGDGIVVSTPTGSTAYSLSAGGPVIDPRCRCIVLSPIAPHNLTMRPLVVPDDVEMTMRINSRGGEAFLSADNRTCIVKDGTIIRLGLAPRSVILALSHNKSFYDTLRQKMMWGIDKR